MKIPKEKQDLLEIIEFRVKELDIEFQKMQMNTNRRISYEFEFRKIIKELIKDKKYEDIKNIDIVKGEITFKNEKT